MTVLTGRSGRVREARKLLRRAGREKAGAFLAEGPQAVGEAIAHRPRSVVEIFVGDGTRERLHALTDAAQAAGIPVYDTEDAAVAALSETVTPQGIVAVCHTVTVDVETALAGQPRLVTVLAKIRDPGNAGTVIRCSDAAGADAVVLTNGSVDPQAGKAIRASAGSLFHLPVAAGDSAVATIGAARARGLTVLAADGSGATDLDTADASGLLARPTAWLFGNEAWGLPDEVRELADHVVRVPIYGAAESLNLATAAAVCLYASARAQRRP